jgi:acetolactate synthase-1/2/3 large subunit
LIDQVLSPRTQKRLDPTKFQKNDIRMDATSRTQTRSTAYLFLEGLVEVGIDYLFCNLGTDHAPLIEELANRRRLGAAVPKVIRCAHENTAAHMAGGYALVTGRGQGVLVHVDVGTANAANAMHNMLRTRIPVLLMAGKAPFTAANELVGTRDTYVQFIQEPFDQASLVRPYIKWEWTLPDGVVAKEALRRAHAIMHAEPQGPVYLMIHRETLTQELNETDIRSHDAKQFSGVPRSVADPAHLSELVQKLLTADSPVLITAYGGRNQRTSMAIEALAEFAGIPVFEATPVNNISREGPCFMGFTPDEHVTSADVGLLVDVDVPWFPSKFESSGSSYWAHIDVDALKIASPMWHFPGNLRLQGDSARILEMLLEQLKSIATTKFRTAAAERIEKFKRARAKRITEAAGLAAVKGTSNSINPHYLFAELGKLLQPSDLVFDETVTNSGPLAMQIPRPLPGTMLRLAGAGLGASGGMALGAKLAAPERMMVQVVGDGSFYFNVPTSVFAASKQYNLPFLSIVLDNSGWGAVKEATLKIYPEGNAKNTGAFEAALCPDVEFSKVAEAFGIYAEKLTDPAIVTSALGRCVAAVRSGRGALLHVRTTPI